MTSDTTSEWNTESDTERLMLRSCRNTAKHPDTVYTRHMRPHSDIAVDVNSQIADRSRRQHVILSDTNSSRRQIILPTCGRTPENLRPSPCSAVDDLTASSRTLHPGKLTRWTGASRQTQDDRNPVSAYRRRTGEGEDHVPRLGRSDRQCIR